MYFKVKCYKADIHYFLEGLEIKGLQGDNTCKNPGDKMPSRMIVSIWNSLRIDRKISKILAFKNLAALILKTSSVAKLASLFPTGNSLKAKRTTRAYLSSDRGFFEVYSKKQNQVHLRRYRKMPVC